MVAGVVHLVAPTARIMPLKAFDASGAGYTSNIIRALLYASHPQRQGHQHELQPADAVARS